MASKTYFNRPVSQLTPAQGAVLAATIRSPAAYDPSRHPERASRGLKSAALTSRQKRSSMPSAISIRHRTHSLPSRHQTATARRNGFARPDRPGYQGQHAVPNGFALGIFDQASVQVGDGLTDQGWVG